MSENATRKNKNNNVVVQGVIEEEFEHSHTRYRKKYYKTRVQIQRDDSNSDHIPVIISQDLLPNEELKGKYVKLSGELRSHDKKDKHRKRHLNIYLFVTNIEIIANEDINVFINCLQLTGYICKSPSVYGNNHVDVIIEMNGNHNWHHYIPCIARNANARMISEMQVGDRLEFNGKIQSRNYFKKNSPDSTDGEWKTAYEVLIEEII